MFMPSVVALSVSPVDDTFISGSLDMTMRLWDLHSPNCQGLTNPSGKPVCSFDPEGLKFAAGVDSEAIKLCFLCSFDKGYNNISLEACCFTPDSKFVMIESAMKIAVLDWKHSGPINSLQFNPKYMMFASACSNMAFWLPCIGD